MNIKIRSFFAVISVVLVTIGILMIINVIKLNNYSNILKDIEHNQHLMIMKAYELRQSSDDLSKFAKMYVVTSNPVYRDNYYNVLDIRNGTTKRPELYEGIYWDLLESQREIHHPLSEKISLWDEMNKLPYTEYEFKKLKTSEDNSNDLVKLEMEAFKAMEGLYKDNNGNYTIKGMPNQQHAINLIYSEEYNKAKANIMLPIDEFLISLKERTADSISYYNENIEKHFNNVFILIGLGIIIFFIVVILIYKKILNPINWLTNTIVDFENGMTSPAKVVFYNDEIGLMTKQFFAMKKKMDDDFNNIKMLALIDPLTNINNRRYFFEISTELLKLSIRKKEKASILMLDIDFFKNVNDTYGHLIGDDVLIYVADIMKKTIRESDIVARFGGEEFVVFLPNTDKPSALKVAEKIRTSIANKPYPIKGDSINITVSIGLTEYNYINKDVELKDLINKSDEALYTAKQTGRNRVVTIS